MFGEGGGGRTPAEKKSIFYVSVGVFYRNKNGGNFVDNFRNIAYCPVSAAQNTREKEDEELISG